MEQKDFFGVELCSRYSRVPNSLGYCGPSDVQEAFLKCIMNGECNKARLSLKKFEGLHPYLELIAGKHGLDPFDYDVVEAYWLGNQLLEGFTREEFSLQLDNLVIAGLPSFIAEKLKKNIPQNPYPVHLMNVVFVGVGNITGSVSPNLENMDNCRVSWGKIMKIADGKLVVRYNPLVKAGDRAVLGKEIEKEVSFDSRIFKSLDEGDLISMHWNHACEKLSEERKNRLHEYTEKVLSSIPCFYA